MKAVKRKKEEWVRKEGRKRTNEEI